jgi:HPt (histidine-containing phosphotransfer) domain-containing protein
MKNITDLTELNKIAEGDTDFIRETLSIIIEETPQNIHNLNDFAAKGDIAAIKGLVHKLKSSYMLLGVSDLVTLAKTIEASESMDEIKSLLPQYISICETASKELQQHIA